MAEKADAKLGPPISVSITIDQPVYHKIMHWVGKAPGEVSGLGKITYDPAKGVYRVIEAILIKQENTGSSTEMDAAEISKAMYELRESEGHLNFWWHSHVEMAVFWSGTDMDTIREIGQHGFVVSTVFNKKFEKLSSVYYKPEEAKENLPTRPEIFLNHVPTQVLSYLDPELMKKWDEEYDAKCISQYTYSDHYGRYATHPDFKGWSRFNKKDEVWERWSYMEDKYIFDEFRNKKTEEKQPPQLLDYHKKKVAGLTLEQVDELSMEMETEVSPKKAWNILQRILGGIRANSNFNAEAKKRILNEQWDIYNERWNQPESGVT